jgi:hypothetical protein
MMTIFTHAWGPYLDDYLRLGWEVIAIETEDRGGEACFMVGWRCECVSIMPRVKHWED